jgi:ribose/xylose/arabinose/galactoside ABC-type transport system permease subunit
VGLYGLGEAEELTLRRAPQEKAPSMTVVPTAPPQPRKAGAHGSRLRVLLVRIALSDYLVLYLTAIYFLAMWPLVPEIATLDTLENILLEMLPLTVAVVGQTFVLLVAAIDLSATAIIAMASVVGASVMTADGGYLGGSTLAVPAALVVFLAVGALIGLLNGVCVTWLKMPSFIVTLTVMMFFSGAAIWYTTFHTTSSSIAGLPPSFIDIGRGGIGGVPYAFMVALVVAAGAHILLSRTVYGRWFYAVGQNPRAALVSGVPVGRVVASAFVISGALAAIASILYTARLETGTPVLGSRILLDIIGAAVIGGVSLFGGKGRVLGALFGVLFLTVVDVGLRLLGLSLFSVFAIKGGVILFAALVDTSRHRVLNRG